MTARRVVIAAVIVVLGAAAGAGVLVGHRRDGTSPRTAARPTIATTGRRERYCRPGRRGSG